MLWANNRLDAEDQTGVVPESRDSVQIVATALNYIDGAFSGDAGRIESALRPALTKILLTNNRTTGQQFLHKMGASDLVEGTRTGMGMVDEAERNIEVEINDISHGMAAVKLTSSRYIDHLQLGKVNGEWKIINVLWVPNPDALVKSTGASAASFQLDCSARSCRLPTVPASNLPPVVLWRLTREHLPTAH